MLISTVCHSAAFVCEYKVDSVSLHPGGPVYASLSQVGGPGKMTYMQFCSVEGPLNGMTASSCKAMLAVMINAKNTQASVNLWFDGTKTFACTDANRSWQSMPETGFYFGPEIK
ncbi:hypothetical protein [Ideonella paludis]|uniref:Uncharacterized protein n=2 Tax=Ideonella paludis TaxID=1233411 RepID=A0ABS5DVC7_9BURK|nr:hypothetical protein [Ideonella paludis]